MVKLNRIYTRSGDDGTTSLGDGSRVPKEHARIEAYGTVDELNAVLGCCLDALGGAGGRPSLAAFGERLDRLQHDLFDLGADLCVPVSTQETARLRLGQARVARIEAWIDEINAPLPALSSFVLPGGGPLASTLHLARTVCRRAERRVYALGRLDAHVNPVCGVFLNRVSDLLFVMARAAAADGERLWRPTTSDDDAGRGA